MVDRLNNSTGALGALRHLQSSTTDLGAAQRRLSSGLNVARARDDAAAFQSAAQLRNESGALKAVTLSLGRAQSVSDVALAAAEQVSKLLITMRGTAAAALGEDLSTSQREAYDAQFQEQVKQLGVFVNNASFDDANILNGSRPNGVTFVADAEASQTVTLQGRNFSPGGPVVTIHPGVSLSTPAGAAQAYELIGASIENVGDQLPAIAAEGRRIEAQIGFVSRLVDALAAGVGRLVDTDLAAETALIQALQVKQELSAQSVSIANGAPDALLALFRG